MSPRNYDMSKRAAAAEATKQRIVEATMELHGSQGIRQTSWDDIAKRAGVGVGTVYRHFPSLDQLIPACGALTFQQIALPEDVPALFEGAGGPRERIARLVDELGDIYERAGPQIDVTYRERHHFGPVAEGHKELEAAFDALVTEALRPFSPGAKRVAAVRGMTSHGTWKAMRERGLSVAEAKAALTDALVAWLTQP
jgi:AcrR family transcriptional regulator